MSLTLTIQQMNGRKKEVTAEPSDTVGSLKSKLVDIAPVDDQKLVFSGKVLTDEMTLSDAKLQNKSTIVLVVKKKTEAKAAEPAPQQQQQQPAQSALSQASQPQPQSAAPAQPASPQPARPAQPAQPARPAQAAGLPPFPAEHEPAMLELVALGFEPSHAQAALRASFYNPERAADYLFNGKSEQELLRMAEAQGNVPRAASAAPAAGAGAARPSGGAAPAPQGAAPQGGMGALSALLQSNPQMLPALLAGLQQENPELFAALQQNPEMAMQLLSSLAGGAGGGRGSPNVIQISEEEKAQIDRLQTLGNFSQQQVVQAWLACDRNESMAAEMLLSGQFDLDEEDDMGDDEFGGGDEYDDEGM